MISMGKCPYLSFLAKALNRHMSNWIRLVYYPSLLLTCVHHLSHHFFFMINSQKRNASNIIFWALTFLLGEINVCHTTLYGFRFQSVGSTLMSPNKKVNARKSTQKRVLLAFLFAQTTTTPYFGLPYGCFSSSYFLTRMKIMGDLY